MEVRLPAAVSPLIVCVSMRVLRSLSCRCRSSEMLRAASCSACCSVECDVHMSGSPPCRCC
jgi:hypothetical protein